VEMGFHQENPLVLVIQSCVLAKLVVYTKEHCGGVGYDCSLKLRFCGFIFCVLFANYAEIIVYIKEVITWTDEEDIWAEEG
jgi:hypothetical protein